MDNFKKRAEEFNLDYQCPRCGHLVRGIPETNPTYHISATSDTEAFLIVRCPRQLCDLAFVVYDRLNDRIRRVYPFPKTSASDYHKAIPEAMRRDFAEANRCWFAEAHKGVVVLCRRVMQMIALDRGARGKLLRDQIDDLLASGHITKSLHDADAEIRYFGNFGAHPQDDHLDDVTDDDARAVLDLTRQFLIDLYVRPHETQELLTKRTKP
jgi:hypothetical protein